MPVLKAYQDYCYMSDVSYIRHYGFFMIYKAWHAAQRLQVFGEEEAITRMRTNMFLQNTQTQMNIIKNNSLHTRGES
jgi:hypothetical protein